MPLIWSSAHLCLWWNSLWLDSSGSSYCRKVRLKLNLSGALLTYVYDGTLSGWTALAAATVGRSGQRLSYTSSVDWSWIYASYLELYSPMSRWNSFWLDSSGSGYCWMVGSKLISRAAKHHIKYCSQAWKWVIWNVPLIWSSVHLCLWWNSSYTLET